MLKFIILCSLIFTVSACSSGGDDGGAPATPKVVNSKPGEGTVKVVGDSLAFGLGTSKADALAPTNCLRKNFPGSFLNLAQNGATSEDVKVRLDFLSKGETKMFFISAGGNDVLSVLSGKDYPEQKTLDDMSTVFDKLLSTNALVVYLALNPPPVPPYEQTERLPKITELARKKGVLIVDGMADIWMDPALMFDDVHPNDLGYEKMCAAIVEEVSEHYP